MKSTHSAGYARDPIKAEYDRKDLLIMKLKAEVFELRQKERDYKQLHE
jgi:hypothetical protein